MILHFKNLFAIKSIDGVFPRINEIYLFVNEQENFMRMLRSLLQLPVSAGVNACIAALKRVLDKAYGISGQLPTADIVNEKKATKTQKTEENEEVDYVVAKGPKNGVSSVGVAQV